MQSLSAETLKEIKRTNWTIEQYLDFINQVKKRGKPTASEMIIPLPQETEESYFSGVKFFMDNHVQTRTWTLMQLVGTELGRDFAINKYDLKFYLHFLKLSFVIDLNKLPETFYEEFAFYFAHNKLSLCILTREEISTRVFYTSHGYSIVPFWKFWRNSN